MKKRTLKLVLVLLLFMSVNSCIGQEDDIISQKKEIYPGKNSLDKKNDILINAEIKNKELTSESNKIGDSLNIEVNNEQQSNSIDPKDAIEIKH